MAPVATFSTEEEALAAANRTEFGLVAYVYTRDLSGPSGSGGPGIGMVGLNQGVVCNAAAPFGGVSSRASAARAAWRASASSWRRSTWRWPTGRG